MFHKRFIWTCALRSIFYLIFVQSRWRSNRLEKLRNAFDIVPTQSNKSALILPTTTIISLSILCMNIITICILYVCIYLSWAACVRMSMLEIYSVSCCSIATNAVMIAMIMINNINWIKSRMEIIDVENV